MKTRELRGSMHTKAKVYKSFSRVCIARFAVHNCNIAFLILKSQPYSELCQRSDFVRTSRQPQTYKICRV